MSARMIGRATMLIAAAALGGCSGIGTVNGVRMNATSAPDATYCDKNPEICVAAGVAIVGGMIVLMSSDDDDNGDQKEQLD